MVPRGNQTCKSHRGAGGVQGPLSAAARIDSARPWVKYHFQSRPGTGSWRDARVARDGCPRRRQGAAVHGDLGLSIRGTPHGLWVTGSCRRRASKATGIDRTPHSGAGAALGPRDDPLNFGAALGMRDPWEMGTPLRGSAGRGLAYWQLLGTESPLEKWLGAQARQGMRTTFCLSLQGPGSVPPGACRALEQADSPVSEVPTAEPQRSLGRPGSTEGSWPRGLSKGSCGGWDVELLG